MNFLLRLQKRRSKPKEFEKETINQLKEIEQAVPLTTEVEIILREHDSLREEIMERMRNQSNYMLIAVTILGAILGFLGNLYEDWTTQQIYAALIKQMPQMLIFQPNSVNIYRSSLDPVLNTNILRFLAEPLPTIIAMVGAVVLDSIAALFIYNDKNKALTVEYIYNVLSPRLNQLTYRKDIQYRHFSWRDFRKNKRFSRPSTTINQAFLFVSNYFLTLVSSIVLFSATMQGIIHYIGFLNQPWFFIIIEFGYILFTLFLLISALKTFIDKAEKKPRKKEQADGLSLTP